jgi:hypothetical protein
MYIGADNFRPLLKKHKLSRMNRTALRETYCRQAVHKVSSKFYRPSDILIHRQNSYTLRSRRCTGRREAQSRVPVNKGKNVPVYLNVVKFVYFGVVLTNKNAFMKIFRAD